MLSISYHTSELSVKVDRSSTARLSITDLLAVEDDEFLTNRLVSLSVDWGDGSPVESYGPTSESISLPSIYRSYKVGVYTVQLTARNYKEPEHDVVRKVFVFSVATSSSQTRSTLGSVVAPILPRDAGFPNRKQWNFNVGQDLGVLESSIRMLLLTQKGERLMTPEYGTNLPAILFDPSVGDVESIIAQEILSAVSEWEPRVNVNAQSVRAERAPDGRSVRLSVEFISRLSNQAFSTTLRYVN